MSDELHEHSVDDQQSAFTRHYCGRIVDSLTQESAAISRTRQGSRATAAKLPQAPAVAALRISSSFEASTAGHLYPARGTAWEDPRTASGRADMSDASATDVPASSQRPREPHAF